MINIKLESQEEDKSVEETIEDNYSEENQKLMLSTLNIYIDNCNIQKRGLLFLVESQWTQGLKQLLLWGNNIGDKGNEATSY